jgi:hypothetical protein
MDVCEVMSAFDAWKRRDDPPSTGNVDLPEDSGVPTERTADVIFKNQIEPGLQVHSAPRTTERRRDLRFPTDDPASLLGMNPVQTERQSVRVRNVSRSGMRLWVPEPLTPGSIIQLRCKALLFTGEVRYCREAQEGYYVGVRVEDVFPTHGSETH